MFNSQNKDTISSLIVFSERDISNGYIQEDVLEEKDLKTSMNMDLFYKHFKNYLNNLVDVYALANICTQTKLDN